MNNQVSAAEKEHDVNIAVLFKTLLKKWWIVFLAALIVAAGSLCIARFLVKPTYQACFTAYVNNKQSKQTNDSLTNSDILASQELVRTYSKILTGNKVLMKASELLGDDYNYRTLAEMVKTLPQDDTEIITVTVTAGSKEEAYRLETISPDCMADIIVGSSMKIVDTTQMPDMRSSPSYTKYTLIGGIVGGLCAVLLILIRALMNDRVSDYSELEERFSVPVVGIIPDMSKSHSDGSGYYGYKEHRSTKQAAGK